MKNIPQTIINKIRRYHEQIYINTFKNVDKMAKSLKNN